LNDPHAHVSVSAEMPSRPLDAVIDELLSHAGAEAAPVATGGYVGGMEPVLVTEHEGTRYLLLRDCRAHEAGVALSARELEIARMIARGHTNRTIAAVLEISPWTVSTHLRRMFAKLDVGSRAAMIAKLVAQGLVDESRARDARRGGR
jgi:DNA-binding CsgD family transcriptional regulator